MDAVGGLHVAVVHLVGCTPPTQVQDITAIQHLSVALGFNLPDHALRLFGQIRVSFRRVGQFVLDFDQPQGRAYFVSCSKSNLLFRLLRRCHPAHLRSRWQCRVLIGKFLILFSVVVKDEPRLTRNIMKCAFTAWQVVRKPDTVI